MYRAPLWEQLPELELYMDQVLVLLTKYLGVFFSPDEEGVTSSMINNYVKQKIVPPPQRKRYTREHMAYFIMMCVLKRVLSMNQIKNIFDLLEREYSVCEIYSIFRLELERAITSLSTLTLPVIKEDGGRESVLALRYSVLSFSFVIFSEINMNICNEIQKKEVTDEEKHD